MTALRKCFLTAVLVLVTLFSHTHAENKVLFMGNSFTIGTGGSRSVPSIFDALARGAGQEDPTTVMAAVGGKNYQYHYENHQAQIASQNWTHVVMQNYSTEPTHVGDLSDHMTYGALLYGSIMANNPDTQVHLYQTWARSAIHSLITGTSTPTSFESTDEMLSELVTNYQALADSLNTDHPGNPPVKVNPIGQAWNNAGGNLHPSDPDYIDLFANDEYHGNSLGYYLAACVHYAAIYQASPAGLHNTPEVIALNLGLAPSNAGFVESIAWQTVVDAGLIQAVPDTTPPTWTGLSQPDAYTLVLQFDETLDEASALDPGNYTIINRGKIVSVDSVSLTGMGNSITLSTATELVGNVLVETSTGLLDNAGNPLAEDTRKTLQVGQALNRIYLDFGGGNSVTGASETWNMVSVNSTTRNSVGNGTGTPAELVSDLLNTSGSPTGISLTMTDTVGGSNQSGTTAGPYPSGATSDSLYGQTGTWSGFTDNGQAVFVFSNLDPATAYSFTFYASRTSASDNRETQYTLTGSSSSSATLDAANNVSSTAQINGIQPNATGDIILTVSKGANNTNGNGFFYIGAVIIDNQPGNAPELYNPVSLGSDFIIDWSGAGQLWVSDNLSNWSLVTPQPTPPFADAMPSAGQRFYRIEY